MAVSRLAGVVFCSVLLWFAAVVLEVLLHSPFVSKVGKKAQEYI